MMASIENSQLQFTTEERNTKVQEKLSKMSNWNAPWRDQVQVIWMKHLTVLHD